MLVIPADDDRIMNANLDVVKRSRCRRLWLSIERSGAFA
jgi:hypothetical protein